MEKHFIWSTSLLTLAGTMAAHQQLLAQQPHIVLIISDQHRGDAMNCMGNPSVVTPNMDALAADGTLFMNGYSSKIGRAHV